VSAGYVIDSSVLITFKRNQPRDIYRTLWKRLESLFRDGDAVVPREALDELDRGTDDLGDWVKKTDAVYETTADVLTVVADISRRHPGWVRGTQNAADPFIIATAKVLGAVAVSNETHRPATVEANLKIPQVASEFGVMTMSTNDFFRELGWQF
jgi:hypothetical protein